MRHFVEDRKQRSLASWSVRTLATMIAGGYMTDGKTNPGLEVAMEIAIDELEAAQMADAQEAQKKRKLAEPAIGSYERFMGAFGGKLQG